MRPIHTLVKHILMTDVLYLPVATVVSAITDLVEGDAHLGAVTAAVELCFRITNLGGFSG